MPKSRYRLVPPLRPGAERVCLLDEESARRRGVSADRLYAEARSQSIQANGMALRFVSTPAVWSTIEAFIEEERQCCPFFAFEEWEEDGEIVLRILLPDEAGDV